VPFDSLGEAQAEAARLAGVANLSAIILREVTWTFPELNVPAGLQISTEVSFSLQGGVAPGNVFYRVTADVRGKVSGFEELFKLNVTYQLVFVTPDGEEFTIREIEAYGSASVLFMVYPYFRETLQDIGGRSGLPGLLLQPLKIPFGDQQSAEFEMENSDS